MCALWGNPLPRFASKTNRDRNFAIIFSVFVVIVTTMYIVAAEPLKLVRYLLHLLIAWIVITHVYCNIFRRKRNEMTFSVVKFILIIFWIIPLLGFGFFLLIKL